MRQEHLLSNRSIHSKFFARCALIPSDILRALARRPQTNNCTLGLFEFTVRAVLFSSQDSQANIPNLPENSLRTTSAVISRSGLPGRPSLQSRLGAGAGIVIANRAHVVSHELAELSAKREYFLPPSVTCTPHGDADVQLWQKTPARLRPSANARKLCFGCLTEQGLAIARRVSGIRLINEPMLIDEAAVSPDDWTPCQISISPLF